MGPRPGSGWGPERRGNQDARLTATAQKGREERGRVAPGVPASAPGWGRKDSSVVLETGQVTSKCKHQAASVVCGHSSQAHGQIPFSYTPRSVSSPSPAAWSAPLVPLHAAVGTWASLCFHSTGFTTTGSCLRCVAASPSLRLAPGAHQGLSS